MTSPQNLKILNLAPPLPPPLSRYVLNVLATKPSHIKVPSQGSLIDCFVFKQQKTTESFTLKHHRHYQLLQKWGFTNHHMVVTPLLKHILPLPPSQNLQNLHDPPPPLARDAIYGEPINFCNSLEYSLKNFPQISVVVLLVAGSVQGAVQKELVSVPFIKRFNEFTLRRSEAAIGDVLQKRLS